MKNRELPVNRDFCRKQSNHKLDQSIITDQSMKTDQAVRSTARISHAQHFIFMILVCADRIELYVMLSQVQSFV